MTSQRWSSVAMTGFALALFWAGWTPENPDAFIFPNIVALIMAVIGLLAVGHAFLSNAVAQRSEKVAMPWRKLWPALLILVLYMFLLHEEWLGFYTTSFAIFVLLVVIYTPNASLRARAIKAVLVSLGFMAVLYSLFSLLLRVQTPTGLMM